MKLICVPSGAYHVPTTSELSTLKVLMVYWGALPRMTFTAVVTSEMVSAPSSFMSPFTMDWAFMVAVARNSTNVKNAFFIIV